MLLVVEIHLKQSLMDLSMDSRKLVGEWVLMEKLDQRDFYSTDVMLLLMANNMDQVHQFHNGTKRVAHVDTLAMMLKNY